MRRPPASLSAGDKPRRRAGCRVSIARLAPVRRAMQPSPCAPARGREGLGPVGMNERSGDVDQRSSRGRKATIVFGQAQLTPACQRHYAHPSSVRILADLRRFTGAPSRTTADDRPGCRRPALQDQEPRRRPGSLRAAAFSLQNVKGAVNSRPSDPAKTKVFGLEIVIDAVMAAFTPLA